LHLKRNELLAANKIASNRMTGIEGLWTGSSCSKWRPSTST